MTLCVDLHYKGASQAILTTVVLGEQGHFFGEWSWRKGRLVH